VFLLGLIHVGPGVGFGVWGGVSPCLSHMTNRHLEQLPTALAEDFPHAQTIALAGRLPGLMKAAGRGPHCLRQATLVGELPTGGLPREELMVL
jgi:hypothetical protein